MRLRIINSQMTKSELDQWFFHTKFGCMGSSLVTHFEPSSHCLHKCQYCYADCYPHRTSQAMLSGQSETKIIEVTQQKADQMIARYNRLRKRDSKVSYQLPELHFSISTDCLQPDQKIQMISLLVMQTWLKAGLLVSLVTKGVPLTPELRKEFLDLFHQYQDHISFQCTCACIDPQLQSIAEPGAPPPEVRLSFLNDVVQAGVKRVFLRINPLLPHFNDSHELLTRLIDHVATIGIKRIAVSYAYGSVKIFSHLAKRCELRNLRSFYVQDTIKLAGGAPKYHVQVELRQATTEWVKNYAQTKGIIATSCGCDNQDLYSNEKCGISWRSSELKW